MQRARQGDPEERLLRPAAGRARGPLRRRGGLAGVRGRRRRRAGRARPRRRRPPPALADCDVVVHSAATVSFDAPLDTAVEVNLLGPSRVAAAVVAARELRRRRGPTRARSTTCRSRPPTSPGTHQGEATRGAARVRTGSASTWTGARGGRRPPPARRHRGRVAADRAAGRASRRKPGPSSAPPAMHLLAARAERLREDWVKRQMVDARASPGPVPRLARRLPVHQGARRDARSSSQFGDRAPDHHRPSLDHRVGPGRAPPGLDPRLPDGRADHRLLRPRTAPRVPRACPRGSPT